MLKETKTKIIKEGYDKMKVLHLISGGDTGGAKTHVLTLLKKLNKTIDARLLCLMESIFTEQAREMEIPITVIKQNKRYNLSIVKKIIDLINNEKYDILHCHGARANFIAIALKPFVKIPIITTIHSDYKIDFLNDKYKQLVYTPLNSFALRLIPYYIAVTDSFKDMLIKRGFKRDNIFVVYNGISFDENMDIENPSMFLSKFGIKYDDNITYIGNVSRLHPIKGIEIFLKGAKKVITENPNVKFLIAGDGEHRKVYEDFIKENELSNFVHMLGHVDDMFSFYNLLDVNVLTSYSESFPYVLLEGARQKKATISSNVGGIPKMIEHGKTGFLFEAGNYNEFSKLCNTLINDKGLRQSMGEEFYKTTLKYFSSENMALTYIDVYNNLLKERKK